MMSTQENLGRADACVVGVDYGTLSGRAVVVRVRDGAELGSAVYEYPHAVVTDRFPVPADVAAGLGPAGPGGLSRRAAQRRPAAVAAAGIDPRPSSGSPPTSPPARWCRPVGRHPAVRAARILRTGRTPTSSCGGTTPPSRRPTGSTRWPQERGGAVAARYGGLISSRVGVRQGPAAARGGPGGLRRDGPLGRGRRLDRLAAVRQLRPQRLHRRLQGHPAGRRLPGRGLPRRPQPGVRGLRRRQAGARRSASWASRPAA